MTNEKYQNVMESYQRCWVQPAFFDELYNFFINSSPEIKVFFQNTDFKKQNLLLRVGLLYMVSFAQTEDLYREKIEELGVLHGRSRLNIRPELYPLWVDSLMKVVRKHDAHFNDELEKSWREALQKGIDVMISKY